MKLFKPSKNKKYNLVAYTMWRNYKDVSEIVMTGSLEEIHAYAKKNDLVWEQNSHAPNGGNFHKSIDGYRSTTFDVLDVKKENV